MRFRSSKKSKRVDWMHMFIAELLAQTCRYLEMRDTFSIRIQLIRLPNAFTESSTAPLMQIQ